MFSIGQFRGLVQCSFLLLSLYSFVDGQAFKPEGVWKPAISYQEGKALYVLGGLTGLDATVSLAQAFSIDLSTPWSTDSVPFKKLANAGTDGALLSAISKDGRSIISLGAKAVRQYSVGTDVWSPSTLKLPISLDKVLLLSGGTTDPKTGLTYFAYRSTDPRPVVLECNLDNGTSRNLTAIPDSEGWNDAEVIWSQALDKLVLFGHTGNEILSKAFDFAYVWSNTAGWSKLQTKGTVPSSRVNTCLSLAYNGTKIVLFGGNMGTFSYLSDIYILDLTTMTWVQGPSSGMEGFRTGPACATTNDHFVVWGGVTDQGPVKTNSTLVYNMRTSNWQTTFSPSGSLPDGKNNTSNPTPGGLPGGDASSKTNLGLVVGASAGSFVAVVCIASLLVFLHHRKRMREAKANEYGGSKSSSGNGEPGSERNPGHHLRTVQGPTIRGPQGPIPRNPQNVRSGTPLQALSNSGYVEERVSWENNHETTKARNPQDPSSLQGQNYGFNLFMETAPRDPQYIRASQIGGYVDQRSSMRSEVPIPMYNNPHPEFENQTVNYDSEAMYSDSGYGRSRSQEISQNISYFGDLSGSVCFGEADTSNDFERVMRNRRVQGTSPEFYKPLLTSEPQYPNPPNFYDHVEYFNNPVVFPYQDAPIEVPKPLLHGRTARR